MDYTIPETTVLYSALQAYKNQCIGYLQNPKNAEEITKTGEEIRDIQPLMEKVKTDFIARGGDETLLENPLEY